MPFLRIPRERVVDAVPVALVLILLSLAGAVPVAAPASMLHIWLWLRHPRSKSRYLIFAAVVGLVLTVFVALPLFANHLVSENRGMMFFTGHIPTMLMAFSAAGILPILYRLVSRCSLTAGGESTSQRNDDQSRAGISDLLALSLLCAIVFVIATISEDQFRWHHGPGWDLVTTLVFSAVGLIAMRLNARCSRATAFANFLLVWVGGFAALKLTFWGLSYARLEWFDNTGWLAGPRDRELRSQFFGGAMMLIALFPIICRRCGVVLTVNRPQLTKSSQNAVVATTVDGKSLQDGATDRGFFAASGQVLGHLALVALITSITLYPFTWSERYGGFGYRLAGWPFPYWTARQVAGTDAPWYWTDSEVWTTVDFRSLPLVADLLLTAIAWMLILPIRPIRNLLTSRGIRFGRIGLATLFASMLIYSVFGEPYFRNQGLDSIDGVTVDDYEDSPQLGLFARIAHEMDTDMRGTSGRMKRGRPNRVTIENASPEAIDNVLALIPLHRAVIRKCQLLPRHVDQIVGHPNLRVLELHDCDLSPKTVDRLLFARKLDYLLFQNDNEKFVFDAYNSRSRRVSVPRDERALYELELTTRGGEVSVPGSVRNLILIVPNHVESHITLSGAEDLESIRLRNTVGEIPDSVCHLSIAHAPTLYSITTDNYQQVDLSIDSAPLLNSIHGFWDDRGFCEARLTSLTISGSTELETLAIDISGCKQLDLGSLPAGLVMGTLTLSGHSGLRRKDGKRLPVDAMTKLVSQIPASLSVDRLVLHGIEFDADLVRSLPMPIRTLEWIDCQFSEAAIEAFLDRLGSLTSLQAADFAPNDGQLIQLMQSAPNLEQLHISGANLSKLPRLLGNLLVVELDDLKLDERQSRGFRWRNTYSLSLRRSNLTDEVLASWRLPNMLSIDLAGSQVTPDAVERMYQKWPSLREIMLAAEPK